MPTVMPYPRIRSEIYKATEGSPQLIINLKRPQIAEEQ